MFKNLKNLYPIILLMLILILIHLHVPIILNKYQTIFGIIISTFMVFYIEYINKKNKQDIEISNFLSELKNDANNLFGFSIAINNNLECLYYKKIIQSLENCRSSTAHHKSKLINILLFNFNKNINYQLYEDLRQLKDNLNIIQFNTNLILSYIYAENINFKEPDTNDQQNIKKIKEHIEENITILNGIFDMAYQEEINKISRCTKIESFELFLK